MGVHPTYPARPRFFAAKFARLVLKACVANELGAEAAMLLLAVANTEDARGYRGPVNFWNAQLLPLIGCRSDSAFRRLRDKCERAGWLVHAPGSKWSPPSYWVTIPAKFDGWDDAASDDAADKYETPARPPEQASGGQAAGKRPTSGEQAANERTDSFPVPEPKEEPPLPPAVAGGDPPKPRRRRDPKPPDPGAESLPLPAELDTPAFAAAWGEWLADRRERRKPVTARAGAAQLESLRGIGPDLAAECVRLSIANGWQGVFPERFSQPARASPAPRRYMTPDELRMAQFAQLAPDGPEEHER